LVLQNGGPGAHNGRITKVELPFWQFGSHISGSLTYQNTDTSKTAVGFNPRLTAHVTPWGKGAPVGSGLVLPGSRRNFGVNVPGGYLGLLPVTIRDADTHLNVTNWVFAVTGWWAWTALVLLIVLAIVLALNIGKLKQLRIFLPQQTRRLVKKLRRWRKRRRAPRKPGSIDGLRPRP
jgi:hypothetical protein